jgi:hypothetical protein
MLPLAGFDDGCFEKWAAVQAVLAKNNRSRGCDAAKSTLGPLSVISKGHPRTPLFGESRTPFADVMGSLMKQPDSSRDGSMILGYEKRDNCTSAAPLVVPKASDGLLRLFDDDNSHLGFISMEGVGAAAV